MSDKTKKKKKMQYDPAAVKTMQAREAAKMGLGVAHVNGDPTNRAISMGQSPHAYAPDAPGGSLTFAHTPNGNPYSMYVGDPSVGPRDLGDAPAVTVDLGPEKPVDLGTSSPVAVDIGPEKPVDLGDAPPVVVDLNKMGQRKLSPEERDLLYRLALGPSAYKRRIEGR